MVLTSYQSGEKRSTWKFLSHFISVLGSFESKHKAPNQNKRPANHVGTRRGTAAKSTGRAIRGDSRARSVSSHCQHCSNHEEFPPGKRQGTFCLGITSDAAVWIANSCRFLCLVPFVVDSLLLLLLDCQRFQRNRTRMRFGIYQLYHVGSVRQVSTRKAQDHQRG